MDQKKRIDKILDAVETRVQGEVGTLLGTEFSIIEGDKELIGKEELFNGLSGKQICAHLDITGDITGKGCLLIGIKDAIRLGGTLIMLPDMELQEVIGREEYREEIEDSYGEIANIIAGAVTKVFEEMYPKACRFIRKEQEVLVPLKVVVESDSPVANETFYRMSSSMILEGKQMGDFHLVIPAQPFGLVSGIVEESSSASEDKKHNEAKPASPSPQEEEMPGKADRAEQVSAGQDPEKGAQPKVDFDKQKRKIDRLLADCQKKLTGEVSALLGVEIMFEGLGNKISSKEEFFSEQVSGKQVLTTMDVVGDVKDTCYFATEIKDAIHLGGVLIMLPPSELINVVNDEEFGEDARDAFGEVANIVSGVYTAVFEEQYSQKLRFVKKSFQEVVPLKVTVDSDEPIPDHGYYTHCMQMFVAGKQLGVVHMLFPARLLQLDVLPVDKTSSASSVGTVPDPPKAVGDSRGGQGEDGSVEAVPPVIKTGTGASVQSREKTDKQKKMVDKLLAACQAKVADEVGALLGADVQLTNQQTMVVGKEDFFLEGVSGKQVIAHMDVVGELEGKSYLIVNLRDAIRIGGVLIMLPAQELESVVVGEVFGDDSKDAYGEIANIIAGVYTSVFEEQYTKRIRFVKTDLQQIVPMKVDIGSADPFPDGHYYLCRADLVLGDDALGKVNMLFPLPVLDLEGLAAVGDGDNEAIESAQDVPQPSAKQEYKNATPDILLIGDDEIELAKMADILCNMEFGVKTLSFKDNVHNYIPGELKAIYLVMKDVNEQAFGAAIKISSSCTLPLIAAGPGWTRSKVIKAVKYGIRDILLTPASKTDIEENVTNNLLKLAA
jgi:chemotaxis protein CheY-P-specific phosphatase CheC